MTTEIAIRDEATYLVAVANVRDLAIRCETVGDAKSLADNARAFQVYAQRAKLGREKENLAAAARLWAERRAGELLRDMPKNEGAKGIGTSDGVRSQEGTAPTLAELGVTKKESARFQKLAEIPEEEFEEAIDQAAEGGRVTAANVHYMSSTSEWSTPQELFDMLNEEFRFGLDVCATPENAKCDRFYSSDDDGLAQDWQGVCWMNPPYGAAIGEWVAKARAAGDAGATVVCLVPARTDTAWWWEHARYGEVRFLRGRLRFGGGKTGAPFPSALVIFGRETQVVWWEAWPPA